MRFVTSCFFLMPLLFLVGACKKSAEPTPTPAPVPNTSILFSWDFENTDPLQHLIIEDDAPTKNSISIVPDPLNPSNKVMKAVLLKGLVRSEASLSALNRQTILYFYADAAKGFTDKANTKADVNSLGNEVWMSLRILKPQEQNTNGIKPSIMQLGPVSNATLNPPIASSGFCQLRVRNGTTPAGDDWNWRVFGSTAYTPSTLTSDQNFVKPNYGRWEKFIIHCKYSSGADGVIEVWKDGVRYINLPGANAMAFNRFRIKWGVYIGEGNKIDSDQTCYFDDVKIAGANSSFDAINR